MIGPESNDTQQSRHQPVGFTPLLDAKAASRLLGVPHTWLLNLNRHGKDVYLTIASDTTSASTLSTYACGCMKPSARPTARDEHRGRESAWRLHERCGRVGEDQ